MNAISAYSYTMEAAENAGRRAEVTMEIRRLVEDCPSSNGLVVLALGRQLEA